MTDDIDGALETATEHMTEAETRYREEPAGGATKVRYAEQVEHFGEDVHTLASDAAEHERGRRSPT